MKYLLPALLIVSAAALAAQEQERKVPNDSQRITVPGCAKGRTFTVTPGTGSVRCRLLGLDSYMFAASQRRAAT